MGYANSKKERNLVKWSIWFHIFFSNDIILIEKMSADRFGEIANLFI